MTNAVQKEFEERYEPIAAYSVETFAKEGDELKPLQAFLYLATPGTLGSVFRGHQPDFYLVLGKAEQVTIKRVPTSVFIDELTLERIASIYQKPSTSTGRE